LAEVNAGQDETFDSLLKRFNRKVQQDGILAELRRREHYEKPSIRRKRKKAAKKRGSARSSRMFRRAGAR
jgi:small subunit ribosomal protein S21